MKILKQVLGIDVAQKELVVSLGRVRTTQFSIRHPLAALGIGSVSPGTINISTNAVRFSTRGSGPEARNSVLNEPQGMGNEGTQVNAMRHTLWQASITTIFGEGTANEIGRAHENNPNAIDGGLAQGANFATRGLADESVDLANNVIGRGIGNANPEMGMKDLALQVLETFKTDGLWTATRQEDGTFSVSRTKITDDQHKTLKSVFEKLDNNGMTKEESKQHNDKYKTSNPNVR
ncbi:hypothetical protein KK062_24480 [Fulvivirgaceae bacterium PWU5]|uniref:DUF6973 domain-containing protein n=1 Tax=Dawidia cretensis TaxID=2782350 RepID=A0AAP2E4A2_9BACT|nr:hypothetical protein [Dawidia cretensis]MBT1711422.1 hypothetical protein [Dawidia cretensis]